MKKLLTLMFALAIAMLAGCASLDRARDSLAQWIGPTDADAVIAFAESAQDRIEAAARDEGENLRLQYEIAAAEARLVLAEARAKLLEAADRAEAEAAALIAREALQQLKAGLSGAWYRPRDRPQKEPVQPVRWVMPV